MSTELLTSLHVSYIQNLGEVSLFLLPPTLNDFLETHDLAYHLTAHLRLNAIYWGLTALCIMGSPETLDKEDVIQFVESCWDDKAGTLPSSDLCVSFTRPRWIRRPSWP
jgi:geranylgeranyl transferase type-2 subunit beta